MNDKDASECFKESEKRFAEIVRKAKAEKEVREKAEREKREKESKSNSKSWFSW